MNSIAANDVSVPAPSPESGDLRRFARKPIVLLGRYRLAGRPEYPCQTRNLSAGGVALYAPVQGLAGERIVLRLDGIGRFEGRILRSFACGFAIGFD